MIFDKEKTQLNEAIVALKEEIAELKGERKARQKELGLTDDVIRLKTEIEDLRIQKSRLTEEHEREKRELTHMIGLEKARQEFEVEEATQKATLSVREENLKAERQRFDDHMAFTEKRFTKEVSYLQDLMAKILERLPTVTVDKSIDDRPRKADAA